MPVDNGGRGTFYRCFAGEEERLSLSGADGCLLAYPKEVRRAVATSTTTINYSYNHIRHSNLTYIDISVKLVHCAVKGFKIFFQFLFSHTLLGLD